MPRLVFVCLALGLSLSAASLAAQTCLPQADYMRTAEAMGDDIALCYQSGDEAPQCVVAQIGASEPYKMRPGAAAPSPKEVVRKVDDSTVELCTAPGSCSSFALAGRLDGYVGIEDAAAYSPDLHRLAVLTGAQEDGTDPTRIELYDTRTRKRVAARPMAFKNAKRSDYRCGDVRWLGDALLVRTNVCAGPGGESWLAKGKNLRPIGLLGRRQMNTYGAAPVLLAGNQWAFVTTFSRELLVQDVRNAKILRQVSLEAIVAQEEEDPQLVVSLPSGKIGVVLGGGNFGEIVVFGPSGDEPVARHTPTRCPVAPAGK